MGRLHPDIASAPHLVEALFAAAKIFPDAPALLTKEVGGAYTRITTLSAFLQEARCVAAHLAALDLKEKDRIGIWADNAPAWNLMDVAAAMNRSATVGIYANEPLDDILYKVNDAGIRMMLVDRPERLQLLKSISPGKAPSLTKLIDTSPQAADGGALPFSTLLASPPAAGERAVGDRIRALQPEDLAKLMYTSGTTGRPKGAMITHRNLLANAAGATERFVIEKGFVLMSFLPNAHIFQALMDYVAWLNGCALAYSHKTTLKEDLPRARPHLFHAVPKVFKMLLDGMNQAVEAASGGRESLFSETFSKSLYAQKAKAAAGLDRALYCFFGGAKLDPSTIRFYQERLDLTLDDAYGISETAGAVSAGGPSARKPGKCGKPIPGLELRIVDDARAPLPPDARGEIALKGPMIFPGYLNRPQDTAKVLVDGWFYTGDRGTLDAEGFVEVFGRAGHRVKFSNGEYYDLEEIGEKFLRRARLIGQIVAAGEQRSFCVGLVSLSEDLLAAQALARKLGIPFSHPRELIYHPEIVAKVRQEFETIRREHASGNPYERIEKAIYLRPFCADNQEATPTQKTRIRHVLDKYERQIEALYHSDQDFQILQVP